MTLTINTFHDLLHIVNTHPEWRHKLIKALFPEIDVPKAFQDLAESQKRADVWLERLTALYGQLDTRVSHVETDVGVLKTDVGVLKTDVAVLKTDVAVLKTDVAELKTDVAELKTDVAELKGSSHERDYRDKATSIFGRYLKRGHDATNEVADQLQAAEDVGQLTAREFAQVLAADLLWRGQLRRAEGEITLVIEASWLAEVNDVERAVARADILRRIGIRAVPVVAGRVWLDEAVEAARERGAVVATDGSVDDASWQDALTS